MADVTQEVASMLGSRISPLRVRLTGSLHGTPTSTAVRGKGANAPFDDGALEARYQALLRSRQSEGKDIISRARFLRQLGHAGPNRTLPETIRNAARTVQAPAPKPTGPVRVPPPPTKRHKKEEAQASCAAQVEETSPKPPEAKSQASGATQVDP